MFGRDAREQTLARLYHRQYRRLCAVAAAVLGGDKALAQDAVQNAWLRLSAPGVRERIETEDETRLRGLLLVTVRNAARNLRRDIRELTLPEEGWAVLPDPAPGPAEAAERADAVAILQRGLQTLPAVDHDLLLLRYGYGFSAAETAALLGMTEGAVRQRAHRARKRLRQWMEQEDTMTDREFDALLQTACLRQSEAEVRAAGRILRPRKILRAALIAAVCAGLLVLGVAAVWPKLELKRTGRNSFALEVEEPAETAPPVTGITFATLPDGYAIVESHSDPGDRWASVTIDATDGEHQLVVWKYALDCGQGYKIEKVGGTLPEDLDPVEQVMEDYVVLDSADDLTPDALKEGSVVAWPTADYYYVADYFGVNPEDVCTILAGIQ